MRKEKIIILGVIFILLFSSITVYAQEVMTLTEEEAIELALKENSEITKMEKELEAVQEGIEGAEAAFYPNIDLSSSYTRLEEAPQPLSGPGSKDMYNFKVGLQQPIYSGGRITATYEQAENKLETTKLNLQQKKQELAYQVAEQYYNVLKAKKMIAVNEGAVEKIGRYVEVARANRKVGIATNTAVLQAKVNHTRAKQGLLRARNGFKLAKMALKNTLNIPETEKLKLSDKLVWEKEEFDLGEIKSYAFAHRSELELLELQKKDLELNLKQIKSQDLPNLNLLADYSNQGDELRPLESEWQITLALKYNIFDAGKTDAKSSQVKIGIDKLDIVKKQLKDKISLEARGGLLNLEEAEERIKLMELSLQEAKDNLREMELKYKEGITTSLDVLDAQTTHQEVKTDYYQAIYDYNLALAKIDKIMGVPVLKEGKDSAKNFG
jgi:outer membrane protein TolC